MGDLYAGNRYGCLTGLGEDYSANESNKKKTNDCGLDER
jgi:hypothetical protein